MQYNSSMELFNAAVLAHIEHLCSMARQHEKNGDQDLSDLLRAEARDLANHADMEEYMFLYIDTSLL